MKAHDTGVAGPPRSDPDDTNFPVRIDNEMSTRPAVNDSPTQGGKAGIVALGIVLLLGALFYGLNTAVLPPPATQRVATTEQTTPPAGLVMKSNDENSLTTGAAMSRPRAPQNAATEPTPSTTK